MSSIAEQQKKLMGMPVNIKPDKGHSNHNIRTLAKGMTEKEVRDVYKTKRENLATKKTQDAFLAGFIKKANSVGCSPVEALKFFKQANDITDNVNSNKPEQRDAMKAMVSNYYRNSPSEADGNAKTSSELLHGGAGDYSEDSEFSKKELAKGVAHEKEHTTNRDMAKEIAKDHLKERKDYYTRLAKAKIE